MIEKKTISAGVVVTDGLHVLLGHVTGSHHWDLPKGKVDPGETYIQGAVRELEEETGMIVDALWLENLGVFQYKKTKDLSIWLYKIPNMPDIQTLFCKSTFHAKSGRVRPEFDKFSNSTWNNALSMVVPDLAKILKIVRDNLSS